MDAQAHNSMEPAALLRPYLLIATVAFVLGFAAFLAAGWALAPSTAAAESWQAPASTPVVPIDPTSARVA